MISYSTYKIIHLLGIMMVFLAFGGLMLQAITNSGKKTSWHRPVMLTHGIGMFFVLLGGFGLLARIGVQHGQMPGWAIGKIVIWLVLGALTAFVTRRPQWAKLYWFAILAFGVTAATLAITKPF